MLSKEEKLQYGEILRQQMKQKQQKKKQDELAKRGALNRSPTDRNVHYERVPEQPPIVYHQQINQKQVLQKKLQAENYNPFGRAGGGAPNRGNSSKNPAIQKYSSQPAQLQMPPDDMYAMRNQIEEGRQQYPQYRQEQMMRQQQMMERSDPMQYPPQRMVYAPKPGSMENIPYQISGNMSNPQFNNSMNQVPMSKPSFEQVPPQMYPPSYQQVPQMPTQNFPNHVPQVQPIALYPPQPQVVPYHNESTRLRSFQNDEIQQVFKKGGRNLLKLENETVDEHIVKQKQKLEIQKYLKLQMQELQMKKKQEKDRLRREEEEQQRRNKQYNERQQLRILNQERKKNEQKQRIIDQNVRNLEKRRELEMQAKAKIQREAKERQLREIEARRGSDEMKREKQSFSRQRQQRIIQEEDTSSVVSSEITSVPEKGFNTQISKNFFQEERKQSNEKYNNEKYNNTKNDKKIEIFTNQIQKMRDEINNQGQMFQQQIQKIKRQAERANQQKRRAQMQIDKLKQQIMMKNASDEKKLFEALKRNDPNEYEQYQQPQYVPSPKRKQPKYEQIERQEYVAPPPPIIPLKPRKEELLVKKKYHYEDPDPSLQGSGLVSLDGDSKKIPVNLPANQKLTMSKIGDYAKESTYFNNPKPIIPKSGPIKYIPQESIVEQVESPKNFKKKTFGKSDELDRLVESRGKEAAKQKWEISSVNSDITKEIQDLLRKKEVNDKIVKPTSGNSIANAGRHVLSRGGIPYEGASLNSIRQSNAGGSLGTGTFDIDRINNRNQNRLRQLRNLGVETINTDADGDLGKLDNLLNKYH